jgi:hypothetical protein
MTLQTVKYIRMSDAEKWRKEGWQVEPCDAHHGANGYGIASKEAPPDPQARVLP